MLNYLVIYLFVFDEVCIQFDGETFDEHESWVAGNWEVEEGIQHFHEGHGFHAFEFALYFL